MWAEQMVIGQALDWAVIHAPGCCLLCLGRLFVFQLCCSLEIHPGFVRPALLLEGKSQIGKGRSHVWVMPEHLGKLFLGGCQFPSPQQDEPKIVSHTGVLGVRREHFGVVLLGFAEHSFLQVDRPEETVGNGAARIHLQDPLERLDRGAVGVRSGSGWGRTY